MTLSIVITTYNRASVLVKLLVALDSQSDPDFQVVVAIDGSTDDTEEVLKSLSPKFELKWLNTHCTGYGLAIARNMGILAASGEIVAILDDDSFPRTGYVAACKNSAKKGVITGGPRYPANKDDKKMAWKMRELHRLPALTPMTIDKIRQDWPTAYLIENNICLFRSDWIALGLFSQRLKIYGFIGQEFFGRATEQGFFYQYSPLMAIMHHGEIEGDNGLFRAAKTRQTRLARILRPALMTRNQYAAQISWANALAESRPDEVALPTYLPRLLLSLPRRVMRAIGGRMKQFLRHISAGMK